MSTPAKMAHATEARASVTASSFTVARTFRAKHLKLELAQHLKSDREAAGIAQDDTPIRQQTLSEWESEHEKFADRAPNLLHVVAMSRCKGSRPYAISALRWLATKLGFELTPHVSVVHDSESARGASVVVEITDVLRTNAVTLADGKLCESDLEQRVRETREAMAALQEQLASDLAQLEALRTTTV